MEIVNETWISPGTTAVKKDSLKKHINSAPHKQAAEHGIKRNLVAASYTQEIVEKMLIGHCLKKICIDDRKGLGSAYYLALKERLFTDFPELLTFQKNGPKHIGKAYLTNSACTEFADYIAEVTKHSRRTDIANANYYAFLNDESTDSGITEQVVYLFFSM